VSKAADGADRGLTTTSSDAWALSKAVARAMTRRSTYPGFAKEVFSAAMSIALYPAGVVSEALKIDPAVNLGNRYHPGLPLRYLDPEAASTPVILVHGAMHNRSGFLLTKRALKRYGYRHVDTWNYNLFGHTIEQLAQQLADHVFDVLFDTGATRVNIVGHSLGGLIARYYIQELGGHEKVHTCITLGTPHQGTYAAIMGRGKTARQLRPGSPLLKQLKRSARKPIPTRFVSYYSNLDSMVLPAANAKLNEPGLQAENVLCKDLGHLSLLTSPRVTRQVVQVLANPEPVAAVRALRRGAGGSKPA